MPARPIILGEGLIFFNIFVKNKLVKVATKNTINLIKIMSKESLPTGPILKPETSKEERNEKLSELSVEDMKVLFEKVEEMRTLSHELKKGLESINPFQKKEVYGVGGLINNFIERDVSLRRDIENLSGIHVENEEGLDDLQLQINQELEKRGESPLRGVENKE